MNKLTHDQQQDATRLKTIFERRKSEDKALTQETLASSCGWKTQSAAQQYLGGLVPLNLDALIKFSLALDVDVTEISPILGARILSVRGPDTRLLSTQAMNVADAFDKLNDAQKQAVLTQLIAFGAAVKT